MCMSKTKPNYQEREKERRISTVLSFFKARPNGVPIKDAAYLISEDPAMQGASTKKVDEYMMELERDGFIYLTQEGIIKVTPKVSSRFKEWIKNGDTQ